ncbi:hypothetical protein [Nonomuraea aurantiaca]|uniref:hypothetical protein n=1 Tax=Nonomuraea aurantiaca TaxID=2878562 RepID=UPI001CD941F9|nr:hypothetical protein [Nonomuraea aurantiaca]MCA2220435.1 hypothetical protein [Nonomuraea aurantiaca]
MAAEVISPILRDSPETWANLATVADIIRSHGGEITTSTGGHIHVGVDRTPQQPLKQDGTPYAYELVHGW